MSEKVNVNGENFENVNGENLEVEQKTAEKKENKKATEKTVEKKKTIVIAVDERDPDNYVPVCINGKIFQVKKGEEVEVPEEVYNILKRSGYLGIKVK